MLLDQMRKTIRRVQEMKQPLLSLLFFLLLGVATASPASSQVRGEIEVLLARLQSSGCQFQRNGSWYSASAARDHLLRKLEYIERRNTLRSTEQFIKLAASKSSSSGKPYQVKCGTEAAVESQQWLNNQLASMRSVDAKPAP